MSSPGLNRSRRQCLLVGASAALSACAGLPSGPTDRVEELASGRRLTVDELLRAARQADVVLLGERHDNPHHHQRRGAFIAALGAGTVVVAEQLPRGAVVGPGADTLGRLVAAGFDARAWQWPQHEALFAPLLAAGVPLRGGNLPLAQVRQVAREGAAAWPVDLRDGLSGAPLAAAAQARLAASLVDGHCGQLPLARVAPLVAAQRARDAAMAQALLSSGGRPAVLVAGNGHVALDHGVGQMLRRWRPALRVVSVGFAELDAGGAGRAADDPDDASVYTHRWATPPVPRGDPCEGFRMPPPAAPAASAAQRTV